jgi:hypothetical protein
MREVDRAQRRDVEIVAKATPAAFGRRASRNLLSGRRIAPERVQRKSGEPGRLAPLARRRSRGAQGTLSKKTKESKTIENTKETAEAFALNRCHYPRRLRRRPPVPSIPPLGGDACSIGAGTDSISRLYRTPVKNRIVASCIGRAAWLARAAFREGSNNMRSPMILLRNCAISRRAP